MIPKKIEKNNIAEKCARIVVDTFCGYIERVSKAGVFSKICLDSMTFCGSE